jgi:hypothetical protein
MDVVQFASGYGPGYCFNSPNNTSEVNPLFAQIEALPIVTQYEKCSDGVWRNNYYKLYKNGEASSALPVKRVVVRKSALPEQAVLPAGADVDRGTIAGVVPATMLKVVFNAQGVPTDVPVDVSATGVPAGYYFYAYVGGSVCTVEAGAAFSANDRLATETATGKVDNNTSTGENLFATAMAAAAADGDDALAKLDGDIGK